jgi:hypothetical protein
MKERKERDARRSKSEREEDENKKGVEESGIEWENTSKGQQI